MLDLGDLVKGAAGVSAAVEGDASNWQKSMGVPKQSLSSTIARSLSRRMFEVEEVG